MRTLVFILLFAGIINGAAAQNEITDQIFFFIYNQKYDSAAFQLKQHEHEIDPYYFAVLNIDKSYWENVTGTDKPDYAAFESTLQKYEMENAENLHEKVIQLMVLSYQLRYELKRYQIIDAIFTRSETVKLYHKLENKSQLLSPGQQQLFQLYHALILYFNNYLKPGFMSNRRENIQAAVTTMERLTNSEQLMTKTLANYFLGKIRLKYEKQPAKAAESFHFLVVTYPGNQTFKELLKECTVELNE
jgi:hypothetical protein